MTKLSEREREAVERAIALLDRTASMDCCCDDTCTIETPGCDVMYARAARKELDDLLDPKITTLHPDRLTNPAERIFFEEAARWMDRSPGLNHGYSTLEHILNPNLGERSPFGGPAWVPRPTQRDAEVAGTLMQWLGTNCGLSFLKTCDRRIEQERAERSGWRLDFPPAPPPEDPCARHADMILSAFIPPGPRLDAAKKRLVYALRQLLALLLQASGEITTRDGAAAIQVSPDDFVQMARRVRKLARETINSEGGSHGAERVAGEVQGRQREAGRGGSAD